MRRKITAFVLAIAMLMTLTLLPGTALAAATELVPYIDENGVMQTITATKIETGISGTAAELNDGWYYVEGAVTTTDLVVASGHVRIILKDGCVLTANSSVEYNAGIKVELKDPARTLTIYAQSTGGGVGKIIATGGTCQWR